MPDCKDRLSAVIWQLLPDVQRNPHTNEMKTTLQTDQSCTPMTIMVVFGKTSTVSTAWRHVRRWLLNCVQRFKPKVACFYYQVVISTQVCWVWPARCWAWSKGMSKIGYDAMALGNHEFDNPLEVLFKQQMGKLPDAVCQHLRQRDWRASVPTLCYVQQVRHQDYDWPYDRRHGKTG